MSLLETQNFLAKVFTDEILREKFLSEPVNIGKENNLSEAEIEQIRQVLPEQIKFFADSLFYKRLREVEKFLPLTRRILDKDFEIYFREFANQFLPKTIKRHLEDAIKFCGFLQAREFGWLRDLIVFEQARLIFNGHGKRFLLRVFQYNIKEICRQNTKAQSIFPKRKTFAVWLKIGGRSRHFVW